MIRDFYEQGRLDKLVPVLAADELSDEDREGLGPIHPSFWVVNTSLVIVAMG
jgi:hypothetical protein